MLGGSEFRLRRGFACGKTLVRCKGAAGQKGGWTVRRTFSMLQIKMLSLGSGLGPPLRGGFICP